MPAKIMINEREFAVHKHTPAEDLDASKHIVLLSTGKSQSVTSGLLKTADFTSRNIPGLQSPIWGGDIFIETFDKQYGYGYSPNFGRFLMKDARINLIDLTGWHLIPANHISFSIFMGRLTDNRIPDGSILRHALITFRFAFLATIPGVYINAAGQEVNVRFHNNVNSISFYVDNTEERGYLDFTVKVKNTEDATIYLSQVDLYRSIQPPVLSDNI